MKNPGLPAAALFEQSGQMYGKEFIMIFDSHAHMDLDLFDADRDELLERIHNDKISYIVNPGVDIESSRAAVELAHKYDWIYAAIGYHPQLTAKMSYRNIEELRKLAEDPNVVAIGEIGLDYYKLTTPKNIQQFWFRQQIELAVELGLPFCIHDREAHGDTLQILEESKAFERTRVLFHCYSGSAEMARQLAKKGCYFSISGSVTYGNNKKAEAILNEIALDHMLVETDAPFLTPEPFRGQRNDPSLTEYTVRKIAEYKKISFEEVAEATCETAKSFFSIK